MPSGFEQLTFSPERISNLLSSSNNLAAELVSANTVVVSSANCKSLVSSVPIVIPLIDSFCLIAIAKVSTAITVKTRV